MPDPARSRSARFIVSIVLVALVLIATFEASLGPSPRGPAVPLNEFSAGRARQVLQRLVGDGIPHPVGSPQHSIVRDRVIAEFRALGYDPVVERDLACSTNGSCAWVENILATLPGREPGGASILDAHYDSVPAGPGGGDDATGVAALVEVARALRTSPQPRHAVLFLIDDGEEVALLGAEAFVRRHRPADYASVFVLEARGSSGRTLMFETSPDNGAIVGAYARGAPRPSTSSVFFSVYQRLPNGTNFTVFKNRGMTGMAAAFIGDPAQYHTPQNRVENVPDTSIQHMGDTALGVAREIGENGLAASSGNASYFDVFTLGVVRWPEALNPPIAIVAFALLAVLATLQMRAGRFSAREFGRSLLAGFSPLILAGLAGYAVLRIADVRIDHAYWPASGRWLVLAAWACGFGAVALTAALFRGRIQVAAAWTAVWIDISMLGIAAAFVLPGAAYLFAGPAIVAALFGAASWRRTKTADSALAAIVPLVAVSVLVFPFALELFGAMGSGLLFGIAVLVAIAMAPLLPMLLETRFPLGLAVASLAVIVAALGTVFVVPVYTPEIPRPLSIVYQMDRAAAGAHWLVEMEGGDVPAAMQRVASWREQSIPSLAIGRKEGAQSRTGAEAPAVPFEFPVARVVAVEPKGARSLLRVELRSPRGAPVVRLRFDLKFDPRLVSMGELTLDGEPKTNGVIVMYNVPPEGIVVGVEVDTAALESEFVVDDETLGLPAGGAELVAARAPDAVPQHRGDRTLLTTLVRVPK